MEYRHGNLDNIVYLSFAIFVLVLKGPLSATPLFLFTCENLAIIFYSEPVETKKNN